jgi:hypothetical protein
VRHGTTEEFFDLVLDPLEKHDLISAGAPVLVAVDLDRLRLALDSFEGDLVYEGLREGVWHGHRIRSWSSTRR